MEALILSLFVATLYSLLTGEARMPIRFEDAPHEIIFEPTSLLLLFLLSLGSGIAFGTILYDDLFL
jgi:hypothetical protein